METKQRYEVQTLDWNQFMPVEEQKWICAAICDTFEEATRRLEIIQRAFYGVRVALYKDES
jgi:hypothetical protein